MLFWRTSTEKFSDVLIRIENVLKIMIFLKLKMFIMCIDIKKNC